MKDELSHDSTIYSDISKIKNEFDVTLKGIREEFDDHLETINDNTNEIQANYEYICKIDAKLEKLAEKIEEIHSRLSTIVPMSSFDDERDSTIELTQKEKDVFMILYASEEKPLTYKEIAKTMNESEFLISGYVTNLIEKGVPIIKRYMGTTSYLMLDKRFRDKQAKHNLLNIRQTTVKQFF